jgi:hypothetical protein
MVVEHMAKAYVVLPIILLLFLKHNLISLDTISVNMLKQFTFLIIGILFSVSTSKAESWLTWSEFAEDGVNINVYLSREIEGRASAVKQLSLRGMNITPAILVTQSEVWVVWVNRANPSHYLLRYARIDTTSMDIIENGNITTRDKKTYAPTITLSSQKAPVVAWSGLAGDDEEIRLTYFRDHRWLPQQSITDNDVPDTFPAFTNGSNGEMVLSWEQITPEGVVTITYTEPLDVAFSHQHGFTRSARGSSSVKIKSGRHGLRKDRSINKYDLPPSLIERKNRFLMGSWAEITP